MQLVCCSSHFPPKLLPCCLPFPPSPPLLFLSSTVYPSQFLNPLPVFLLPVSFGVRFQLCDRKLPFFFLLSAASSFGGICAPHWASKCFSNLKSQKATIYHKVPQSSFIPFLYRPKRLLSPCRLRLTFCKVNKLSVCINHELLHYTPLLPLKKTGCCVSIRTERSWISNEGLSRKNYPC